MIKKFLKIDGTGRFLNYAPSLVPSNYRTTEFEKLNLIYGENGSGKTTLAIILKSLKGSNTLLTKVRSFDHTIPQRIEILTDSTSSRVLTFSNSVWDNNYPNIEIFDVHFINENIYTGLEIQNTHKKNLLEIVFGLPGIQLKTEIQDIKDKIQIGNKKVRELTEKIELAIDKLFNATDYCNIKIDSEIESKIRKKEEEILAAKSYREIQSKSSISKIPLISLPFKPSSVTALLSTTVHSISEKYIEKFRQHKEHLSMNGYEEEWIKQGYISIIDNSCPFCLRPFDETVEILEAYKQYFNEEYNLLQSSLAQVNSAVSNFNLKAHLIQIEAQITANLGLIDFWKKYLSNPPVLFSLINQHDNLLEALLKVKSGLETKVKNPLQVITPTEIIEFQKSIDDGNKTIEDFNSQILLYNDSISKLKTAAPPNIAQLELELKKSNAIKKRSDPTISSLCLNLLNSVKEVDSLNIEKSLKQQQLDSYSTQIFSLYSDKINQNLKAFAPYLEIKDLTSGYVGTSKEPMIKYALYINGNEIKQVDDPLHPSFKYSLSEGDKSALALAFFLSKLEVEGNIQDKIIVFDDPVSSFDLNRKSATINKLIHIGQKAGQLFVLTHNLIFASEFWKSANQIPIKNQCSKIEFLGNTACIVEYVIETETLSSILKDCQAIKNYLINGCVADQDRRGIARCIRPALEGYFHLKFFDIISSNDWLGDFIFKVRNAISTDSFYRLQNKLLELTDINDYSKKYHHRFNNNNETEPVTDAELRNYCQRTLDLIQVI